MTVLAEIEYGARKSKDYSATIKKYNQFTSVFEKISFSQKASEYYGKIRSQLEHNGETIGPDNSFYSSC